VIFLAGVLIAIGRDVHFSFRKFQPFIVEQRPLSDSTSASQRSL